MFAKNIGTIDRTLRIVAGLALLSLFFLFPDASWRYLTLIGVVPLLTGLLSSCPLYLILGISSCPVKRI